MKNTFLVEIGTEELPPTQLRTIVNDFVAGLETALNKYNISFEAISSDLATPRRIAALVHGIGLTSNKVKVEKKGPARTACYDAEGNLTKAALGWLNANKISIEQTTWFSTDKGEWLLYTEEHEGQKVEELLFPVVKQAVASIQIAKGMRWANNEFSFIRPVHTFTMLLNDQIIDGEFFGVKSSNLIYGHRFQGEKTFTLSNAQAYETDLLEKGGVVVSFNARLQAIKDQSLALAKQHQGYIKVEQDFLEEIASLVEKPNVLVANFSSEFLVVPKEALIGTMEGDQRYFPIFKDAKLSELLPHFIFVSNIAPADPSLIIAGNEKVIRPRLTDAKFFFEQDQKQPLINNLPRLKSVVFQNQLGTVYDKVLRVKELATYIAQKTNADIVKVEQAALLAKCDLMTNLVFEYPETQGIMGRHYALLGGEDAEVAQAIFEQYLPRNASDELPTTLVGSILALADKLDTLVGVFGINQIPKGAKDPFALRRATIGIIRILTANKLDFDLADLVKYAIRIYEGKLAVATDELVAEVLKFVQARYASIYESEAISFDVLQSVLNANIANPLDFEARLKAVAAFKQSPACADLVAGFKRVNNLLAKEDVSNLPAVNRSLFELEPEKVLYTSLEQLQPVVSTAYNDKDYTAVLENLAVLRDVIFAYFDNVVVNHGNNAIRNNRLATLVQLQQQFLLVADLTALVL